MRSFRGKSQIDQIYLKAAQDIGQSIRKQIISQKKYSSVKKVNPVDLFTKSKTQHDSEKSFWDNPYQIQKNKWKLSQRKLLIWQKQDIDYHKRYELQRFKQRLKSKSEQRKHSKVEQIQMNHSRVKEIRLYHNETRQFKLGNYMHRKQQQTELFKRSLQKKKIQARISKRQKFLQLQFKKWHRQEDKLQKHKKRLMESSKLKTLLY